MTVPDCEPPAFKDADAVIDALVVYVFVKDTVIVPVAEELDDTDRD